MNVYFACAKLKVTIEKLEKAKFLLLLLNYHTTMEFNVCLSLSNFLNLYVNIM